MKKLLIVFSIFLLHNNSFAQVQQLDSLKNLLRQTTKPIEQFDLLRNILEISNTSQVQKVDSASCLRLLKIAQQLKNDSLKAISYNWIGSYFAFTNGDMNSALENFFKGIPLAEKAKDKRRISSLYFDISLGYFTLSNYEDAYKYIIKGYENLPDKESHMYQYMLIQYQRNMAIYFFSTHQPDSALKYAQATIETNRAIKSPLFELAGLSLNGGAYGQLGDNEMAEIYFKRSDALAATTKLVGLQSSHLKMYIPFLLSEKKISTAKEKALELLQLGIQSKNNNVKMLAAGFMRQIYDTLHRADSAYYYSRIELATKDSLFSQENINKIQALAFKEQLRNIEEEAKLAEAAQQRKQNIQFVLIALGIIIFVILFLALSRRHITNTKLIQFLGVVALLVVFEFFNLLLHPFLESITHHNPILMLLALVCIAALLVPLHHRLEIWAKHKLVEKNKAIRLAAAKKTIEKLENRP
nr:hypothetical protein [Chitinophagaceae bacterium]